MALLLVLAQSGHPNNEDRLNSRWRFFGNNDGGGGNAVPAIFDAGTQFSFAMGELTGECACTTPTGVNFQRAGTAECTPQNGQTLVQCATDQARVMTGAVDDPILGIFTEATKTNLALWAHDLSNAAWVKVNMLCPKTATGLHGANTASTCTSSASSATVLQTVVNGNAERATSFYIKRRTGTGTVKPFANDGVTLLADISSSLSTTLWKRVVSSEVPGCTAGTGSLCIIITGLHGTSLNPVFGFQLGTSGDAVDIDFYQDERGGFASSPIETTTVSVARAADLADVYAGLPLALDGGAFCAAATVVHPADSTVTAQRLHPVFGDKDAGITTGSTTDYVDSYWDQNPTNGWTPESVNVASNFQSLTAVVPTTTTVRASTTFDQLRINGYINGVCGNGSNRPPWRLANWTRARLNGYTVTSGNNDGVVKMVQLDPNPAHCQRFLGVIPNMFAAAIGDSITGTGAALAGTTAWPFWANATWAGAHQMSTPAMSGAYTSQMLATQWELQVRSRGYQQLWVMGGVNDLGDLGGAGHDLATIESNLQTIWDEARSDGLTVHPMTVTPWASAATSSAPKQVATTALNTFILAYCTAHGLVCQDTWNSALNNGSGSLAVAYDSGDGLHPNAAGMAIIAGLVTTAVP